MFHDKNFLNQLDRETLVDIIYNINEWAHKDVNKDLEEVTNKFTSGTNTEETNMELSKIVTLMHAQYDIREIMDKTFHEHRESL
jgi:predicted YcjX-like family ATPase